MARLEQTLSDRTEEATASRMESDRANSENGTTKRKLDALQVEFDPQDQESHAHQEERHR